MIEWNTPDLLQVLTFTVAIILPLLVGLVTKLVTSATTRTVLLLLFTAVLGFLNAFIDALQVNEPFDILVALSTWLASFIIAVASYFGVWKPTGVATKAQAALGGTQTRPESSDEDPVGDGTSAE